MIGLGTEIFVANKQESSGDPSTGSKLSAAAILTDLANKAGEAINPSDAQSKAFTNKFLSAFGKAANLFQLAEILSSDATLTELATEILFTTLEGLEGDDSIGQFRFQGRVDQFQFDKQFSKKGVEEITEFLNVNTALIEERLVEIRKEIEKRTNN